MTTTPVQSLLAPVSSAGATTQRAASATPRGPCPSSPSMSATPRTLPTSAESSQSRWATDTPVLSPQAVVLFVGARATTAPLATEIPRTKTARSMFERPRAIPAHSAVLPPSPPERTMRVRSCRTDQSNAGVGTMRGHFNARQKYPKKRLLSMLPASPRSLR